MTSRHGRARGEPGLDQLIHICRRRDGLAEHLLWTGISRFEETLGRLERQFLRDHLEGAIGEDPDVLGSQSAVDQTALMVLVNGPTNFLKKP